MKHKNLYLLLISVCSLLIVSGCNGQSNQKINSNELGSSTNSAKMKTISTQFTAGKDYMEFVRARVMDKVGFQQPVEAFSFLMPEGWTFDGGIIWNPPGTTCAGTNLGVRAVSPDGKYSFEMMPSYVWSFVPDPQLAQIQQQQQFPKYCSYGEPMNADVYFKQVFAPNELGNPTIINIKENNEGVKTLQEYVERKREEYYLYNPAQVNFYPSAITATVKWDNNSEAIVLCGVLIIESINLNQYNGSYSKNFVSTASERVVFMYPAGENEKAANILSLMMGSYRTNTAWKNTVDGFWKAVSLQEHREHVGRIQMIDEQTRQMGNAAIAKGQQNLNNMDANIRSWEASQQSQDRMHSSFVKSIREVENYRDETGTIELSSGYNHAWSRSDGSSFIMSDDPNFDPSSVFQDQRWKEMKRVD